MLAYIVYALIKITIGDVWAVLPALSAILPAWPPRSPRASGGPAKRLFQLVIFLLMLAWTQPARADLWPSPGLALFAHRPIVATGRLDATTHDCGTADARELITAGGIESETPCKDRFASTTSLGSAGVSRAKSPWPTVLVVPAGT